MWKRWILVSWMACGVAVAQVPSPDDPLWEFPAAAGVNAPEKVDCDMRVTSPGEKFCLWPAAKPGQWHRAEDIIRPGSFEEWRARNGVHAVQPDRFLQPTMALKRFNGWPVVSLTGFQELEFKGAGDFARRRFTIFVVGRKVPGTEYGAIFGNHEDPQYGALYWAGSNGIVLNVESANPLMWQYEQAEEFHLIALRCDFETVTAFLNGQPLETKALSASKVGYPVNRGIALTHVGRFDKGPPRQPVSPLNAPRVPSKGAELAEIVLYDRTLSDEEFVATTRYLIRKFGIPVPGRATGAPEESAAPLQVFTFAPASDPAEQALADHPVMLGFNSPTAKQCSFTAKPGETGWCLRAADGMHAWLRGDDVWTRTTIMTGWKAPPAIGNEAIAPQGHSSWLMPNTLATLPVVRVAERSSLRLKTPMAAKEFTAFIVGRQTPGSFSGIVLSSDVAHDQSIAWRDGKTLELRGGGGVQAEFDAPQATEFHIAAISYRDGVAAAYIGNQDGQAREIALPSGIRFDFVGVPSRSTPVSGGAMQSPFAGLRPPANPAQAADLAEIILWPRALDREEMAATLRYLRRKYAL